ncbi:hypothetical protein EU528_11380 [Candidatus Thorarchaeota archaeon]|nr:MAG: hypothetical protein EU528_11380 [Candidatus Thorarchaeota archaeon]
MLNSEQLRFKVGESHLSGVLEKPCDETSAVVLVLHPHPLYGGDIHNPVVSILVDALLDVGFATFRFNFRGATKRSDYTGISGALDDAIAASELLERRGMKITGIAGYSFGGSVALRYCSIKQLDFLISVSSSLDLYLDRDIETGHLSGIECPVLMFHGTSDLTIPFENMINISSHINSKVKCISLENEGHFYHHSLNKVHDEVRLFLEKL